MTTHSFGQHAAREIVDQARAFLQHAEDVSIWKHLSEKQRGRMTHDDVKRGRAKLEAADASISGKGVAAGGASGASFPVDSAHAAAHDWLTDQLTHARGKFHEDDDQKSTAALNALLTNKQGHGDVATDVRTYVEAASADDELGKAISASYADKKTRDAVLKDGAHLAEALEEEIGAPAAAIGARVEATEAKDDAVAALARWGHRWYAVARRVCGAADLHKLGLAEARHHPAHRGGKHPVAPPVVNPAPPSPLAPASATPAGGTTPGTG